MNSEAEIIEEIDEGCVGYGVYIISVISPYDYLIKTEPECFHVALRVEIKIPVITHDLTDMIENIIHMLRLSKTISMCQGKGSLSHNNREFTAKNIDPSRTPDNIIFKQQDLGEAYHQLFDGVIANYNAKQKRNDRKIPDYFQHLFNREPSKSVITGANKQKSFYEDLVQIGTKDDTGVGTPDAEIAVACLKEYMENFQERNPNLYVFNAVMHLDEATPHLHIDYIPLGHFFNGLEKRNAMARALEEMGYGKGANAINRWRLSEWKVLHDICTKHGFEISEPKKSRGYSFTTAEYGEYKDTIRALEEEKTQAENERDEAQAELEKIAQKRVNYRQGDIHSAEFSDEFNALCITFEESLTEAQLTTFHKLLDCVSETAAHEMRAAYKVGFKDGAALMKEIQG